MEPKAASASTRRDRGVALLVAIWTSMLVAMLALGAARESRSLARLAAEEVAGAEARAAAEAGIARAALALAAEARGVPLGIGARERAPSAAQGRALDAKRSPLQLDGEGYAWRYGGATLTLTLAAERGKLDLNAGDEALVASLLRSVGAAAGVQGEIERLRGPRRTRAAWRIEDKPFQTVDDLSRRTGLSPAESQLLAPYVTTLSGLVEPDLALAPRRLFDLAPLSRAERAELAAARRSPSRWAPREVEAVTITSTARRAGGPVVSLSAIVHVEDAPTPIRMVHATSR